MHNSLLIADVPIALSLALVGGLIARRVRLSPIVGYLLAGVAIGPFTPGYQANGETLHQLAQVGVVFIMFGVGLHFNLRDLLRVRKTAVPAAVSQIVLVAAIGLGLAMLTGLRAQEALVLGMAVSISSTVVLVRALEERGLTTSTAGRMLVGWLIVQDLATIVMLVLLPVIASNGEGGQQEALLDAGRAVLFVAVALTGGARLVPALLRAVGQTGSRELFILVVVCLSLGIAVGAELAGASLALGAFIAGIAVSETEGSHQAASDVLPLRDAFAVLFFVSVGMLIDPASLVRYAPLVMVTVVGVMVVKSLLSGVITALSPVPARVAFIAAAGLGQAGEFSFILADAGRALELLQPPTYQALLGASAVSIAANPLMFRASAAAEDAARRRARLWRWLNRQGDEPQAEERMTGHVVIAGAGRVGRLAGAALARLQVPYAFIDSSLDAVIGLQQHGLHAYWGDAASPDVLEAANVQGARLLILAVPDAGSARLAAQRAREMQPGLPLVARAHSQQELELLRAVDVDAVVVPEFEGAAMMLQDALALLGVPADEADEATAVLRDQEYGDGPGRSVAETSA